mmetsp:Transcript_16131/g.37037  ORF Transcript_16131/g.37037 Transcript_16131/m.37037 type:complete len:258 (-) Transcript_16131:1045-1818(-)
MEFVHPDRPLVVLAGWLGCKRRSLRRYESLYQELGFTGLVCIASLTMVLDGRYRNHPTTIRELAREIIETIHASRCPVFLFHAFSNGGCFLWEQVRAILEEEQSDPAVTVRQKLVGVVFDSSPACFLPDHDHFQEALQYCPWPHRMLARWKECYVISPADVAERALQYWESMRAATTHGRELYLYSQNDELTPYEPLHALVQHRQEQFGRDLIRSHVWISSPHCCHLWMHPQEYRTQIEAFVNVCLSSSPNTILSRL